MEFFLHLESLRSMPTEALLEPFYRKRALALVDVKVLDHFVVGDGAVCSFAERALI